MENLKITIEGFGVKHSFEYPADVATAFLGEVGIQLDNPQNALAEAAEYMLRPVTQIGADAIAKQTREALTAQVKTSAPIDVDGE